MRRLYKLKQYTIYMTRIGYGHNQVVLRAYTKHEAIRKAKEWAVNHEFSEKSSEYRIDSVYGEVVE